MKKGTKVQWNYAGFDGDGKPKENPTHTIINKVKLQDDLYFQQFIPGSRNDNVMLVGLDVNGRITSVPADSCKVDSIEIKNQALLG